MIGALAIICGYAALVIAFPKAGPLLVALHLLVLLLSVPRRPPPGA